ncbi:MAG: MFS transporter [Deltaproteobacteria bacterium]|nr:MFS transporter [Deltaproteobacteria bacterium]
MSPQESKGPRPLVSRLLAPIVDVRPGELAALFVSMAWIFCALTAYYIIKPIRSIVLQEQIGVDNKPIALLATTAFVAVFATAYGAVVPRVARKKLIVWTFVVFIGCLCAFASFLGSGGATAGYVFYVWVSTFNLMVVSQFWALAADVWTKEEGKRLFGFIGVGGVTGGIFGTQVVSRFAEGLTTAQMLVIAAGLLAVCLGLALFVLSFGERKAEAEPPRREAKDAGPDASGTSNVVSMVLGSPYLRLIALMMLILNIVNTNNEWILDKVVEGEGFSKAALKRFYGDYFFFQNVITFLIQLFVTGRVQRRYGARGALVFEPVIGLVGALSFLASPVLAVIRWHKTFENASDYSIQSNTRELLYLPVSKVEKYGAKNFNDTFVVRGGDALAAGSIIVATSVLIPWLGLGLGLKTLIGIDFVLCVAWLLIVQRLGRMNREKMEGLAGGAS